MKGHAAELAKMQQQIENAMSAMDKFSEHDKKSAWVDSDLMLSSKDMSLKIH